MDKEHFDEMRNNFLVCKKNGLLSGNSIYLFGHCDATIKLADLLIENGYKPKAILDNSDVKQGIVYKDIPVQFPDIIRGEEEEDSIVLIVSRFYEAMNAQLRRLEYKGSIRKLVNYNTFAEYSLSSEAISRKKARIDYGKHIINQLEQKYPGAFRFFCPFSGLGDVYFCMSYLPYFIKKRGVDTYVICVIGKACADVVSLFADCSTEVLKQSDMDAAIQAELYMDNDRFFIVHQDRPYVINLAKALKLKKIPMEDIYRSGIFGLSVCCKKYEPSRLRWKEYERLEDITKNGAVILSPYAKSVTALSDEVWESIVKDYKERGFQVYTNTIGDEQPLYGTKAISPRIEEMKSVVERAGIFIGIRSGLCDILRTAKCRKIALYPDYNYCGTIWKAIDMYGLEEFVNIVVKEGFEWRSI